MAWVAMAWAVDADSKIHLHNLFPNLYCYRLGIFLYVCYKIQVMLVWGMFNHVFSTIVSLLFLLTIVTTIVVVILDNRNPLKTLAWVLVLAFLPIVGLVL